MYIHSRQRSFYQTIILIESSSPIPNTNDKRCFHPLCAVGQSMSPERRMAVKLVQIFGYKFMRNRKF